MTARRVTLFLTYCYNSLSITNEHIITAVLGSVPRIFPSLKELLDTINRGILRTKLAKDIDLHNAVTSAFIVETDGFNFMDFIFSYTSSAFCQFLACNKDQNILYSS